MPVFFNPLSKAEEASGDADSHFVHAGMLACMRGLRKKLVDLSILDDFLMPMGAANGYKVVCTGHSLGAGIAVLLALELRPSLGESVRFVGFEAPGCVVSYGLAKEIEKFNWYTTVIAQDWVPRISFHKLQALREQVVEELIKCQHSKYRLMRILTRRSITGRIRRCHICVCRFFAHLCSPCSAGASEYLFEESEEDERNLLASLGDPESLDNNSNERDSFRNELVRLRRDQRQSGGFHTEMMYCPGRLVFFQPLACQAHGTRETRWVAKWGQHTDIEEIFVAKCAVHQHFPFKISPLLHQVVNPDPISAEDLVA